MLPDFPAGTLVRLNGSGLDQHRKLTKHGGQGINFGNGHLTDAEARGTFTWLGTDNGRNAIVRSTASGREGMLFRGMLRKA